MMVFVHTDWFRLADPQYNATQPVALPVATADSGRLIGAALSALAALYRPGFRYKKAGVIFLDLVPAANVTGGFFDLPDSARSRACMRAVDGLNRRFGRDYAKLRIMCSLPRRCLPERGNSVASTSKSCT
jgi:DNA polymerase V